MTPEPPQQVAPESVWTIPTIGERCTVKTIHSPTALVEDQNGDQYLVWLDYLTHCGKEVKP